MSESPPSGSPGLMFQEIRTAPPARTYSYRSIAGFTYFAIAAVGINAFSLVLQIAALLGRWGLLSRMIGGGFPSHDAMMATATASDRLVGLASAATLLTVAPAYIAGGIWIYNAACNIRALGARGMQISPGWAVGWYAVPFASLVMPFQAMEEIYQASESPAGWKSLKTPILLRSWWGAWLIAGVGGSIAGVIAREATTAADLLSITQFLLVDVAIEVSSCVLFLFIVWRVYQAQEHGQRVVGQVAQVFS